MGKRLPFKDFSSALSFLALVQRYWEVWTRKTYSHNQGRFAFSSPTRYYVSTDQYGGVCENLKTDRDHVASAVRGESLSKPRTTVARDEQLAGTDG